MSSSPAFSPRIAAINRLRSQIEELSSNHSNALQRETFLGSRLHDSEQNQQRRAELVALVKQLEVFGQE